MEKNPIELKDGYLITGGAGFIGTNLAARYLDRGRRVTVFDNFSRPGTRDNLRWLTGRYRDRLRVIEGDVRRLGRDFERAVEQAEVVVHLAGQVGVTTSLAAPREDFEINALGTLNVLEAVRRSRARPIVVYSSTNKVYGRMLDVSVVERKTRYVYRSLPAGVPETTALEFTSPYGCSKGAADQYVLDYARVYGLRTLCFRQSCIYGPHQFGNEDQGWVAWFALRALRGQPVTIFGDGKQVRDVLYVDDLGAAYDAAIDAIERTSGEAFNLGGGPDNTLSLLDLLGLLDAEFGLTLDCDFADWRPGDQRVYVSDVGKARKSFGWGPTFAPRDGLAHLVRWLRENRDTFPASELQAERAKRA